MDIMQRSLHINLVLFDAWAVYATYVSLPAR